MLRESPARLGDVPPSWLALICTAAVSEWAFRAGVALMRHVSVALPTGPCGPEPDMLVRMRAQLDATDP
jgi:hypothetical protein